MPGELIEPERDRPPALRASDIERDRAAALLRHAAGEGRLTFDELDDRTQQALEARTREQLERLLADVLSLVPGAPHPLDHDVPTTGVAVNAGAKGARWIVSIMGGSKREGRWRIGGRCTNVNVMGGSELDLNDVELTAPVTELRVYSLMGGSDIRVPEDLNVEISEFAFMGGNGVEPGAHRAVPGGPLLRVRLISVMGGTDLKRGRRKPRRSRRHGHSLH